MGQRKRVSANEFLKGKTIKKLTYGKDVKHNIFRMFFEDGSVLVWSPRRARLFGIKTFMRGSTGGEVLVDEVYL